MKAIETKEEQEQFLNDFIKFGNNSMWTNYEEDIKPFIESLNKPVTGWKVYTPNPSCIAFQVKDSEGYGIDISGEWQYRTGDPIGWSFISKDWRQATPDEVSTALIEYAEKKYKEGMRNIKPLKLNGVGCILGKGIDYPLVFINGNLNDAHGYTIFKDGNWAEIVDDNSDAIKVLERSKALIQEQIDKLK